MMVAAHTRDIAAAAACGLKTAHVARPDENGPGRGETAPSVPVDLAAADLSELAEKLGAWSASLFRGACGAGYCHARRSDGRARRN